MLAVPVAQCPTSRRCATARALFARVSMNADPDDDGLLPARMINEAVYCPRLFWLEHVAGEWRESHDTLDGTRIHKRVDRPGPQRKTATAESETPTTVRSMTLASSNLGVIAKIDLVEIDGDHAVPIDYKRGSVPGVPGGAYDPERVQICVQGMLLREAGYRCNYGELYFAESRRRVRITLTEELVSLTSAAIADATRLMTAAVIPPPLIDSPKCGRCSLAPICMPDETNTLRNRNVGTMRTLVPESDDALPLYVVEQGARLGLSGEVIEVRKNDEVLERVRLLEVSHVSVFGNVSASAPLLRALAERDIPLLNFSYGGWLAAITHAPVTKNLDARIAQFKVAANPEASMSIARRIVEGKIRNQRTQLRRSLGESARSSLQEMSWAIDRAQRAHTRPTLLGHEGNAARVYFGSLARMLKVEEYQVDFEGRNRRPPRDRVNALLSFAYALLVKECYAALLSVGLEPGLGVYHVVRPGRPGLALDLAEEFRPVIADSVVINAINVREIEPTHFLYLQGEVALSAAGRRAFIAAFERRMNTEIIHPEFGYRISYRRTIFVQARLLSRCIEGELESYPVFTTR